MKPIISLKNVSYTYEDNEGEGTNALCGVSLDIGENEFVAVLGHNGSGKSTLAKLLNGLYSPTDGKVIICGMDTSVEDNIFSIRQSAGMIFQNPDNQLVATIVEEDIAFGLENLGIPPAEIRARVDEALSMVRMERYSQSAPHMLSGGQKQRVAIAGIIAMKPRIIIMDEPTAMLDPSGRKEVMDTIFSLREKMDLTVVCITHFMEEAARAQRIVVMDGGEIAMEGTPKEIFRQVDRLKEIGLDVPAATELAQSLRANGVQLSDDILTPKELSEEICRLL